MLETLKTRFKRIGPFGLVGGLCLVLNIGILNSLMFFGVFYFYAAIISTVISLIVNFFLLEKFVFHDLRDSSRAFIHRFWQALVFNGSSSAIQLALMGLFVEVFNVWPTVAQISSIGIIFVAKFAFFSLFIYADKTSEK